MAAATPMMISVVGLGSGLDGDQCERNGRQDQGQRKADEVGSQVAIDAGEIGSQAAIGADDGGSQAATDVREEG